LGTQQKKIKIIYKKGILGRWKMPGKSARGTKLSSVKITNIVQYTQ